MQISEIGAELSRLYHAVRMDAVVTATRRIFAFRQGITVSRSSYPVFRQKLWYWDRVLGGWWRIGDIISLLAVASLSLMPATLFLYPRALLLHILLVEFIGIFLSILSAALIVRERESRTWDVLRSSQLSNLDIVSGKLDGVLYLVWEGIGYLVQGRIVGTLLALPLMALLLLVPGTLRDPCNTPIVICASVLGVAYLTFLYRPYPHAIVTSCFGLLASTLADTTSRVVALSLSLQGIVVIFSSGLYYWFSPSRYLANVFTENPLGARMEEIALWLIPLVVITIVRLLLAVGSLGLATYRVGRLIE